MNGSRYVVFVLCVVCRFKWTAAFTAEVSLFKMECPRCGEFNSFPSFVPEWYLEALENNFKEEEEQ